MTHGHKYILIIINEFIKWIEFYPIPKFKAELYL